MGQRVEPQILDEQALGDLAPEVDEVVMPQQLPDIADFKNTRETRKPKAAKKSIRHRLTVASSSSLMLLVFLVLWGAAVLVSRPQNWPINKVEVIGVVNQQDQLQVQKQLKGLGQEGFFSLNLPVWQSQLESVPWVAGAQLQRVWPDHVRVQVSTRQPAARWGEKQLIDISGKIFSPGGQGLPTESGIIDAPDSLSGDALALFAASSELLASEQLFIQKLKLSQRGSVEIQLKNGLLLKAGNLAEAENRLRRMVSVYKEHLSPVLDDIDYVDLRHTHGFAVGWRESAKARKGKNA